LDNVLLSPNVFITIQNSGYSYALIKTTSGGHSITCVDPISVLVYGYGNAVSYGYFGGMNFKNLEENTTLELIKSGTVSISPNPTNEDFTISFELEKSCNIEIILFDVLGKQVKNIYNDFTNEGIFRQTIRLLDIPKGVYYLQISNGEFARIERIVVN